MLEVQVGQLPENGDKFLIVCLRWNNAPPLPSRCKFISASTWDGAKRWKWCQCLSSAPQWMLTVFGEFDPLLWLVSVTRRWHEIKLSPGAQRSGWPTAEDHEKPLIYNFCTFCSYCLVCFSNRPCTVKNVDELFRGEIYQLLLHRSFLSFHHMHNEAETLLGKNNVQISFIVCCNFVLL